jgi:O-antigen biosynthesis protein
VRIPFCVCWANENWTRHWDGGSRDIVVEQLYDSKTQASLIADFCAFATDPRYIKVNGKPLVILYRPLLVPDVQAFCARLRTAFAAAGFSGVHLAYVESMEAIRAAVSPAKLGFDACIEFPPQGIAVPRSDNVDVLKPGWKGSRYGYPETIVNSLNREASAFPCYPCVFPNWDNTARQPNAGVVFDDVSPEAFQAYVEAKLDEVHTSFVGDERLLFVNAWNEWAEGDHLEPDRRHGHRFLEALRNALVAKRML